MSQDVVTHDYIYRVEEHLKGCLSKLTDWCVAEIQQQHKRADEQQMTLEQLQKRAGDQEKIMEALFKRIVEQEQKSPEQDEIECKEAIQRLVQRLASLEQILVEAASSGLKNGASSSATPPSVSEQPTVEPCEKTDSESGSVSGAETLIAGIAVVTPRDP